MAERFALLSSLLEQSPLPLTSDDVAKHFKAARKADVAALLETLVHVGNIRVLDDGRYVA